MRVVSSLNGSSVVKRGYKDDSPAKYRAFPPADNKIDSERAFETEKELAAFLSTNTGWKSYFRFPDGSNGQHVAKLVP